MDRLSDPSCKLKYNKSKLKLKRWESEFRKKTGNIPSQNDIKEASCEIRDAYKYYWLIKMQSLGQDSMLEATFVEPTIPGPTVVLSENNATHAQNELVNNEGMCPYEDSEKDSTKTSVPSSCKDLSLETPVSDVSVESSLKNMVPQEDAPVTESSGALPSSIWGSHLNMHKDKEVNPPKRNLSRSSSSFQLSEKLFVGAKFKKRNPRKSMSFSNGRFKERSLTSSDHLLTPSDSSFSLDSSQGIDDGFPVGDLECTMNALNDTPQQNCNFKVIKNNISSVVQPVSAVQKMMEKDLNHAKSMVERSLDKGWLARVMQADDIVSQELTGHIGLCSIEPFNIGAKTNEASCSDDSDPDIIYGSDNESKSPRKVEKEEKARLALRSMSFKNPAHVTAAEKPKSNLENAQSIKPETNVKKRKLDAIEAAMAVLSERQKNDKNLSQPTKRLRKSETSKARRLRSEESCSEQEVDENLSESENPVDGGKPALSKKAVLEKKVVSGIANDNFVRINIKKKVFVRGKKTMTFQKFKKQQWKNKKRELSAETSAYLSRLDPTDSAASGGLRKCFKCGDVGHFSRQCTKMKGDSLIPYDENCEEEESPFPSLAEVEEMAKERKSELAYCQSKSLKLGEDSISVVKEFSNDTVPVGSNDHQEAEMTNDVLKSSLNNEEDINDTNIFKEPVNDAERKFGAVEPLYPPKSDGSVAPTPTEVYDTLKKFGHQNFRPGQESAIMRILSGLSTLVTLSTGSGKSLCYQLPAYLYASKRNCITLVVSPLVSLMDDQITGLPSFINGAALHTAQTEKQREKVIDLAKAGKLHFLLVSPEAVVAGERQSGFGSVLRALPNIAFACIDEAHCVSQWSHNFRPSYLVIFKVLREKFGVQTILGLTATATQLTVSSIIEHMQIPDGRKGVIQDVPLPNNLLLTVSHDLNRDRALVKLLESDEYSEFRSIIVYCTRREECERLATLLRTCLNTTTNVTEGKARVSPVAEPYHAGLKSGRRKSIQTAFMSGKLRIVVATVAFGMGINKADIRSVVHYNMPSSFESYVQEIGRAGRDGLVSRCHLFMNSEGKDLNELRRHIFADSVDRSTIRKLLQRVFVPCKCSEKSDLPIEDPVRTGNQNAARDNLEDSDKIEDDKFKNCAGHEVAFSIEETVAALDLPEENITTLLCYLELHDNNLLCVMPKAYTKCRIVSYKGMKHIREVARSCPPLAMAIAMHLMSGKPCEKNFIEFPVVNIASVIGWDSGIVKRELKNLEWLKVDGSSRRSGIKVEFSDLGFRIKAPGNLSAEKMDAALDFLHERAVKQEQTALSQLQTIFSALTCVSYPGVMTMMKSDETDLELHSNDLKTRIRAYFAKDTAVSETFKSQEKLENGEQIANDIRQIVNMYKDYNFTGRAVARIFHGISSPNFPALSFRQSRFWRAHLESDFKLICFLATRLLLKMR